ncbi:MULTISPECIES: glycosyltransferase family 4 protein [Pseudorhizobium]|jgi:glycosyltransferase involved in cell wall biosynthesis|uniref:GDP-mannose-dependent alpha-mannosyltransferase n=1 Tax=Pseudorhizobium pelagicum TaxID=1509405 RepID=A0A922NZR5_9HYPH|nr:MULTISPECIES: glycosyltransferase family 1 protein [Pseudorhizobium]MBA4785685.1 glycosyltransferase family 1 protein [Hyphomicrobiales bacterium]MBU1316381.1 glycosyltransferase family 1 protein [Alphaproteobacteria bacterium]MDY6960950.1 glycosyltransferase family 1 protein [Pseudomonadota bacterium]KEQ08800.1 GDP-mannose-dependent alpha-mannosyltransferase [Pseudorhizobium pelagicum]KEQ09788.1 GDP-mannose-dependent alpha-mannosyltransferase [Pseudorhizobium pelagicum]|tara:strand:- start:3918 stop:4952 length:1035 start_codon:yes stop_codon:yes gene_type:complete
MNKITIVTDAWYPQVNGVVRSIQNTNRELERMGIDVAMVTPQSFRNIPCPTYPEIRLSVATYWQVAREIEASKPDAVHIATEGPLGLLARRWCLKNRVPFSTSYHTRFPEYVAARFPVPIRWMQAFVRWFHNAGNGCMVATASLERELAKLGLRNLLRWSRGIDQSMFHPRPLEEKPFGLPRPIFLTVGRVSVEKNLPAFLDLKLPGSKVVVGDGPAMADLARRYPDVLFTGLQTGKDLADIYAQADVFVFPSRTDTFGNTILEALASGVPVAAYPVTGPIDIIEPGSRAGVLHEDLQQACLAALDCSRDNARALARKFTWEAASRQFLDNVRTSQKRLALPAP